MVSSTNCNSEKFIPEKDVKKEILIKTTRPGNLDPVKKLGDYLQELLKQKKRPQDATIDNTLEKVRDNMGPNCEFWLIKQIQVVVVVL